MVCSIALRSVSAKFNSADREFQFLHLNQDDLNPDNCVYRFKNGVVLFTFKYVNVLVAALISTFRLQCVITDREIGAATQIPAPHGWPDAAEQRGGYCSV